MDGNPSNIAWVPAHSHNFKRGRTPGGIYGLTVHDMEAAEGANTAESCAKYFQRSDTRTGGAHYCADMDSIVQCVRDGDTAAHAPGVNGRHLGLELAGFARQSEAEWNDPYSVKMLQRASGLLALKAEQYDFPLVYIDRHDLARGNFRGVTTHNEVSQSGIGSSHHWDPGPNFPMRRFLDMAIRGAHNVDLPGPADVLKLGSKGEAVAFFGDMGNIMAKAGYALNEQGKPSHVQIPIPTNKDRRKLCTFNDALHARAKEIQRFGNAMLKLQGKKPTIEVDGEVGPETTGIVAFFVPIALAKIS